MYGLLLQNPSDFFLSRACRRYMAVTRWNESGKHITEHGEVTEGVMPGAIAHNRQELDQDIFGSSQRTTRLLGPLSALDPVYGAARHLKVLSIGPRTEMELFHLMGIGFELENISALDLISCSELITPGDMHSLPYPDKSFDVVISSWVLNYSKTPQIAVNEMVRVTKSGGLIAIGVTHAPGHGDGTEISDHGATNIIGSMVHSSKQLEALIGEKLSQVLFQSEPGGMKRGPVMLIASIQH